MKRLFSRDGASYPYLRGSIPTFSNISILVALLISVGTFHLLFHLLLASCTCLCWCSIAVHACPSLSRPSFPFAFASASADLTGFDPIDHSIARKADAFCTEAQLRLWGPPLWLGVLRAGIIETWEPWGRELQRRRQL
jgi:hypothetical protein